LSPKRGGVLTFDQRAVEKHLLSKNLASRDTFSITGVVKFRGRPDQSL
jgi:hypothetical protein